MPAISFDLLFNAALLVLLITIFTLHKNIIYPYYIIALMGLYAWIKRRYDKQSFTTELRFYAYAVITLFLLITLSAALYNSQSLFEWRYAAVRSLLLLPLVIFAFATANITFTTLLKMMIATAALISLFWLAMVLIEGNNRGEGWLSNPINRGNMGMLAGVICLTAIMYFTDLRWKLIAATGFFSGVLLSILSETRGGWLVLFAVVITLFFHMLRTNKAAIKYLLLLLILIMASLYLLWDYLPLERRIEDATATLQAYMSGENKATSVGYRLEMWRATLYALSEKPWFGWGWNNFDIYFSKYVESGLISGGDKQFGHPHSEYFLFLGELGIVGFLVFMTVLIYPLVYFVRKLRRFNLAADARGAQICLLAIIIHEAMMIFSLVDDNLSQWHFLLMLTVSTVALFSLLAKQGDRADFLSNVTQARTPRITDAG